MLRPPANNALEILDSVVDRDGDVLVVEDILEGFGKVPVSVDFSAVSDHMFIGFKAGIVRIYPDGGATEAAAVFDDCVDIEEDVRGLPGRFFGLPSSISLFIMMSHAVTNMYKDFFF